MVSEAEYLQGTDKPASSCHVVPFGDPTITRWFSALVAATYSKRLASAFFRFCAIFLECSHIAEYGYLSPGHGAGCPAKNSGLTINRA